MTDCKSIPPLSGHSRIGIVVIGRNEGERLRRCLNSVRDHSDLIIYVDSGSTDGSVELAKELGAVIVELDMRTPFSAARARNAGFAEVDAAGDISYVQFVDGDCEIVSGWLAAAQTNLNAHPERAVVVGRLRERFPDASIYNRLCDLEWDTPIGKLRACGGNAMMRFAAFKAADGFDESFAVGEEPELCVRLRAAGWEIWSLDANMGLHDAAMMRFKQWWVRTKRGGFAYMQGALRHGAPPERHYVPQLLRAILWGIGLPLITLIGVMISPWALLLLILWPLQMLRLCLRGIPGAAAVFLTLSKLPEGQGVLSFLLQKISSKKRNAFDYKSMS